MRLPSYIPLLMLLAGAGCRDRRPGGTPPPGPGDPSLPIEWAGCAVVRSGPRCDLGPERRLSLWVPAELEPARLATDAGDLQPRRRDAVQDGWRLTCDIPPAATWLMLEAAPAGAGAPRRFLLPLGQATPLQEIEALLARGKRGEDPGAAARLQEMIARGPAATRGPAQAALGRLWISQGKVESAEPALRAAIAAARAEGRISDEMRDGAALIWALVELRQRFADARAVLNALPAADRRYPEGRVWIAFHAGLLAARTEDLRTALASYRESELTAERLGQRGLADHAALELARILIGIGRAEEALAILDHRGTRPSGPDAEDPCARATRYLNRAWAMVEAARARGGGQAARVSPDADPVRRALADGREMTRACADPHRRLVATLNAADYAVEREDLTAARELVAAIAREPDSTGALTASSRADVLGGWALLDGRPADALARFDEEVAIAGGVGLNEKVFRGEVGAGRALLALGRRKEAVARFQAARAVLGRSLQAIPLAEGRGQFLSGRSTAVRHLVDVLEAGGAPRDALRAARLARRAELALIARLDRLNRLSARDRRVWDEALERYARLRNAVEKEAELDWKRPRSELETARHEREIRAAKAREALDEAYRLLVPSEVTESAPREERPRPGELELMLFPGPRQWLVFANGDRRLEARRFPEAWLGSNESAAKVLDLVAGPLARSRRLRVFAYGQAERIDWHAVTWRGAPLVSSMEVEYGLDLAGGQSLHTLPASGKALVVSNPTGDLPAAAEEGAVVARALAGRPLTRLAGGDATRDAVLAALPSASIFHYAGHAEGPASQSGLSALVLAGRSRVELGDLLATPRMPDVIVLSACGAAGSGASEGGAEGAMLGLAQAFLASGARTVLAPTRPIRDESARSFVADFYSALLGEARGSPTAAFRAATIAAVRRGEESGVGAPPGRELPAASSQSFRLVVQ